MRSTFSILTCAALLFTSTTGVLAEDDPTFLNTVFLIRNGEMNTNKVGSGLNATGEVRAQCLPKVFGQGTNRTIGYIIAEPAMKDGTGTEAIDTVTPLANALGLEIDTSCDRDDKDCVGDALTAFAKISSDAMLVCWEQETLPDIAEDLGVNDVPSWPKTSFDLIWTVQKNKLRSKTNENCPGIDE